MCLNLTKDSARLKKNLRRRKTPIIGYKIVNTQLMSMYTHFQWPKRGKAQSNRIDTELTPEESTAREVDAGFHFFIEKPEDCPYLTPRLHPESSRWCPYQCHFWYQYPCQYKCTSNAAVNKVLKCAIKPKDIVAVGTWENLDCVVATKCEVLEVL